LTPGVKRFGEYGLDFERELEPSIQQILDLPHFRCWLSRL
jgi:hypothetical protein